jgi:hypothetical protein
VTEGEIVATIAGAFGLVGGLIAVWQASRAARQNRVGQIEKRLFNLERENRLMWMWCRQLVDHIYRGAAPPPPAAPPGLFDDDNREESRS